MHNNIQYLLLSTNQSLKAKYFYILILENSDSGLFSL